MFVSQIRLELSLAQSFKTQKAKAIRSLAQSTKQLSVCALWPWIWKDNCLHTAHCTAAAMSIAIATLGPIMVVHVFVSLYSYNSA